MGRANAHYWLYPPLVGGPMSWLKVIGLVSVLVVIGSLVLLGLHWQWVMVHLSQETGTSSSSSRAYQFWSGFGSDLGEVVLLGGIVTVIRHINCNNKGCWRLGRHVTAKGHKLCKVHIAQPDEELNLYEVHQDHRSL